MYTGVRKRGHVVLIMNFQVPRKSMEMHNRNVLFETKAFVVAGKHNT